MSSYGCRVGSWASLRVGGQDIFHWMSEVEPTFLFLFTKDDVTYTPLEDPDEDPYALPTLVLTAKAAVLVDRLEALGIAAADVPDCLKHAIHEQVQLLETLSDEPWGAQNLEAAISDLRELTFADWAERVRSALPAHNPFEIASHDHDYTKLKPLMGLWDDFDSRWLLRALLQACPPDDDIVLDLTDLELSGYLEAYDFDPQTAATMMYSVALLSGTPAVVITEGSTDAEFLRAAIEVRRPHLTNFIRFYDFGEVAGSVSVALSTMKSLAAAGVNNRVIVLLDNDTAAREALRSIRHFQIPKHFAVDRYPDIDLARNYPSEGPTGQHTTDVNGRACSIEMYLGADVLTDPDTGVLRPIVWGSRSRAVDEYQGEVTNKSAVQRAFRAKLQAARDDSTLIPEQDWTGLDAVLDRLMEMLRTCGVPDPAQREGFVRSNRTLE